MQQSSAVNTQTGTSDDIEAGTSLESLLAQTRLDPVDLRILAGFSLGLTHAQMVVQSKRTLDEQEAEKLTQLLRRRKNGEPVAYIVGEKEFYGLPFYVSPDVMIPRPETELLADLALGYLPANAHLLDLGTGSGAIAVAVASQRPDAFIHATDISTRALETAENNAVRNLKSNKSIRFYSGNWFEALPGPMRFDVIVSNPPYIAKGDDHLVQGDLRFEPVTALSDLADGLTFLAEIISNAPKWLKPAGRLFLEHGYDQAQAVRALLADHHFTSVQSWKDLAGIERVSGGVLSV